MCTVATEKGYFSLHGGPLSHLVYDVLFNPYAKADLMRSVRAFFKAYTGLIAFGDGGLKTGGYAPRSIVDWLKARLGCDTIIEREGALTLRAVHRPVTTEQLSRCR